MKKRYRMLKNGDLLFVRSANSGMSDLISKSTQFDGKSKSYSHVALIERYKRKFFIIEASSSANKCIRSRMEAFLKNEGTFDVYRLNDRKLIDFSKVINKAKSTLGSPYNKSYIKNNTSFYCSELVQYAFSEFGIFESEPMTFGPNGTILNQWFDYYRLIGETHIPNLEGGTSPNILIRQGKIKLVKDNL